MKHHLITLGFIVATMAIAADDFPSDRVNAPVTEWRLKAIAKTESTNGNVYYLTNWGAGNILTNDASSMTMTNDASLVNDNINWSLCWSNGNRFPCEVAGIDYSLGKITHHLEVVSDRTNHIKRIAASGELCTVIGHSWEGHMHYTLEYVEGRLGCRQCRFCKAHQDKFTDWK